MSLNRLMPILLIAVGCASQVGSGERAVTGGSAGWLQLNPLPESRTGHSATLLLNGQVLIAGGYNGSGHVSESVLFDPQTKGWIGSGSMNVPRDDHRATLLADGRVLVTGGIDPNTGYTDAAEIYDSADGQWTSVDPLADARGHHSATLLPDGRVLVAGGRDGVGPISSAEIFDPSNGMWSSAPALDSAQYHHRAVLTDAGVLKVGGFDGAGGMPVTELYDGSWSPRTDPQLIRSSHAAIRLADGDVLVAGGFVDGAGYTATAERYDVPDDTWTPAGTLNTARDSLEVSLLLSGRVLVAGGMNGDSVSVCDFFDPSTGQWEVAPSLADARRGHTLTRLNSGHLIVVGGVQGTPVSAYLDTVEVLGFEITTQPDTYELEQPGPLTVGPLDGVLVNDSAETQLIAEVETEPSSGELTLYTDGSIAYTPDAGFVGMDEFTYVARDDYSASSPETVTLTVTAASSDDPTGGSDGCSCSIGQGRERVPLGFLLASLAGLFVLTRRRRSTPRIG